MDLKNLWGGLFSAALCFLAPYVPMFGLIMLFFAVVPLYMVYFEAGARIANMNCFLFVALSSLLSAATGGGIPFGIMVSAALTMGFIHFMKNDQHYMQALWSVLNILMMFFLVAFLIVSFVNFDVTSYVKSSMEMYLIASAMKNMNSSISLSESAMGMFVPLMVLSTLMINAANYFLARKLMKFRDVPQNLAPCRHVFKMYYDIPLVFGLLLLELHKGLGLSSNVFVLGYAMVLLSGIPLLILGIQVFRKLFLLKGWSMRIFKVMVVFSFVLVSPLWIFVLFGAMESCYGLSQYFRNTQEK